MVAYVRRHYGSFMRPTWRLIDPHVIVIHYTDSSTFESAWNTFANDVPDSELHELPGHLRALRDRHRRHDPPAGLAGHDVPPHGRTELDRDRDRERGLQRRPGDGRPPADVGQPAPGPLAALPLPHRDPERDRAQREPLESRTTARTWSRCASQTHGDFDHADMRSLPPASARTRAVLTAVPVMPGELDPRRIALGSSRASWTISTRACPPGLSPSLTTERPTATSSIQTRSCSFSAPARRPAASPGPAGPSRRGCPPAVRSLVRWRT